MKRWRGGGTDGGRQRGVELEGRTEPEEWMEGE